MLNTLVNFFLSLRVNLRKKIYLFIFLSFTLGLLEMIGVGLIYPIANFIFMNNDNIFNYLPYSDSISNLSNNSISIILIMVLVVFFIIKNLFLILINYFLYKLLADIRHGISCDIFNKYVFFKYDYFLNKNSGEITRNLTSLINDLNSHVILPAGILLSEIIILILISLIVLLINFSGSLLMLAVFIIPFYFYNNFLKEKLNLYGLIAQKNESLRIDKINQMIGGIKEIKVLHKENFFMNWYKKYDNSVANSNRIITTFTQLNKYLLELILIISISFFIFFHFTFFENIEINNLLPLLAVYVMAAFKVMPSLNRINNSYQTLRWGGKVIKIVKSILKNKIDSQKIKVQPNINLKFSKSIKFKNVNFSYSKKINPVLKNININIKKGSSIGITGESGSGKTTLLNLLLGILSPTDGKITIDDVDISKKNSSHKHLIGFVPQDVFLADSSILSNVAFGTDKKLIDKKRAIQCLKDAQIYNFISSLRGGINTNVGDRGIRLSGGQKQRLAIARSLYFGAQILVFDEATSALDYRTEEEIMKTINKLDKKYTVIIVAHRINTLENCDYIYQLDRGNLRKKLSI